MREFKNWRELEPGAYVRLKCGCEGFVEQVKKEGKDESDRGFYMAYAVWQCNERSSLEKAYKEGYGPYRNYFNYDMCFHAMPAQEVPIPDWVEKIGVRQKLDIGREL